MAAAAISGLSSRVKRTCSWLCRADACWAGDSGRAAACLEGWGFPSGELLPLSPAKHVFTHVEWLLTAYQAVLPESSPLPPGWVWASGEELQRVYSLPAAFRQWEPLK